MFIKYTSAATQIKLVQPLKKPILFKIKEQF